MTPIYKIVFHPDCHKYVVYETVHKAEGEDIVIIHYPKSVTQVMEYHGLSDSSWIKPYYLERGTLVHHYCVLLAQGWLDWDTVRADCVEFVKAFQNVCWDLGLTYVSAEVPCYDPEFDICGTYDLIMMWKGKRVLVELKTGPFEMHHGLQLAAYERMVTVDDVMGISLKAGKVFVKAHDWELNRNVWENINTGWFVLADWKKDKKRRRMVRYKEAA